MMSLHMLNGYLGKEKSKFKVLKKEYVSLQNNYDVLKDEHETLLLNKLNKSKVDIGVTCDLLDDMPCVVANPCITSKVSISTSCDDLIDMPCSSKVDASIPSMLVDTNMVHYYRTPHHRRFGTVITDGFPYRL